MERVNINLGSQERLGAEKEGFLFAVKAGPTLTYKDSKGNTIDYKIESNGGSQMVIVNEKNFVVSKPYMEFKQHLDLNEDRFSFLVGSNGAKQHILNHVNGEFIEGNEEPFNGLIQYRRDLQRFVVRNGSLQYLIDMDGRIVSDGYHMLLPAKIHGLRRNGDRQILEQIREYK